MPSPMKSQAPSEAKPALGIDIGGTKVRAALVGEGGDVLQAAERPTRGAGQGASLRESPAWRAGV